MSSAQSENGRRFKGPFLRLSRFPQGTFIFLGLSGSGPRPARRVGPVLVLQRSELFGKDPFRLSVHPSVEQSSSKKSEIEISKLKTNPEERDRILILWLLFPLVFCLCLCHSSSAGGGFLFCHVPSSSQVPCRPPSIIRLPHAEPSGEPRVGIWDGTSLGYPKL